MRGVISSAVVAMAVVLSAACGGAKEKSVAAASGQVIELTTGLLERGGTDTVRFGRLNEGEIAVRSLTLHNASDEPTVVVAHERSCGCVNVAYERRPIMPGESCPVEFTFDSRGEFGWQLKLITLHLGAAGVPLKIYVEAEVEW